MRTAIKNRDARRFILKLNEFINHNVGFMVVLMVVLFGLAILGFQKDNQRILEDTKKAAENSERIVTALNRLLCDDTTPKEDCALVQAVDEIKSDSKQNTLILCRLILGGDLTLEEDEARDIERICQEQVRGTPTANDDSSDLPSSGSTPQPGTPQPRNQTAPRSNDTPTPPTVRPSTPPVNRPTPTPTPDERPPLRRLVDAVGGVVTGVVGGVRNLLGGLSN